MADKKSTVGFFGIFTAFDEKKPSYIQIIIALFYQFSFRILIYYFFSESSFCHGLHE